LRGLTFLPEREDLLYAYGEHLKGEAAFLRLGKIGCQFNAEDSQPYVAWQDDSNLAAHKLISMSLRENDCAYAPLWPGCERQLGRDGRRVRTSARTPFFCA
jgi:hypothetical protein